MNDLINDGRPFVGTHVGKLGISPAELRSLSAAHLIRRVLRGVYVDTRAPDTRALRASALHLVKPPGAVFYGSTVAFLLGVDTFPPRDRFNFTPQCVVLHHASRCRQALVQCREGYLPERDLMEIDGLVTTNPVRTAVDLLRSLWRPHALGAVDAMAHGGLVIGAEVQARVATMRRYPGIVQARSLARLIDPRAESPGESWQRLRLVDAGFPVPDSQLEVFDRAGLFVARLDHAYEGAKVGIEYDGREYHTDEVAKKYDASKRQCLSDILGWRLAITTRECIFGDDPSFEHEIGRWIGIEPWPRRW